MGKSGLILKPQKQAPQETKRAEAKKPAEEKRSKSKTSSENKEKPRKEEVKDLNLRKRQGLISSYPWRSSRRTIKGIA